MVDLTWRGVGRNFINYISHIFLITAFAFDEDYNNNSIEDIGEQSIPTL